MGKAKRAEKRARRKAKGTAAAEEFEQATADADARLTRRRQLVFAIPPVTFAVAAGLYWGLEDSRLAGVALLLGGVAFMLLGLGLLGASVEPRDRDRSGSIDFGNK